MSTASAMVAAAGNGLQMYDTSCSYQTALDLKRMSSGSGMTGPMTSSVVGTCLISSLFSIKIFKVSKPCQSVYTSRERPLY